ncbi:putative endonuclease or glycosyl hydrolase [Forsythia ovata]|uniref:Endonuclease or glycosyl hydrolase n=1 Tax=Forsythia ovata TaxID=205694 RepID=A0ABD1QM48_9LAMI
MSISNISALMLPPEYSEDKRMANASTDSPQPYLHQMQSSFQGPVAILWDIENCPVPSDVRPEDVAGNIRMALRVHPVIDGVVTTFSAYGDFNAFPRRLREGCQRTGVKLIDVPNGRKDAADKAILVDMFLFALDNRPPSSILLISGDVDFAPALHVLGQRGYTIILVIPSRVGVSSALSNAGQFVWDWPSVARGEGFVPPAKVLLPPYLLPTNITGFLTGCEINDNLDCQNEEEAIVYRGISKGYSNKRDFSLISQSPSEYNSSPISMPYYPTSSRSHGLPSGLNEVSARTFTSCDQNDFMWVQPGDLNGLKGQLVKLLELSGGCLPLIRLSAEYQKIYGRPLYVSEYGALKLVNLLEKMGDAMAIEGRGTRKFVYLRNSKAIPGVHPLILAKRDKKGKEAQDPIDVIAGAGSSDEPSDDERSLNLFKYELQEILVSYYCRISLGCLEAIYRQKYKRSIDYQSFGVNDLGELLDKIRDIVVLQEEPVSKRKFLVAVCD